MWRTDPLTPTQICRFRNQASRKMHFLPRGLLLTNFTEKEVFPTNLVAALRKFAIFSQLDEASLAGLASSATHRSWAAGSMLFQRGDAGDFLFAITKGRVRLSLGTAQGRELVLGHVGPGEILGEIALIDGLPRSADATAVEAISVLMMRRNLFLKTAIEHPDVMLAVAKYLCSRLRNTNYQMESIALYDLQTRVVRFILLTLQHLYGSDLPKEPVLRLGLNQSDLSAVLGASRPKVNQALKLLTSVGAIRRDGDTLVCNLRMLQSFAEVLPEQSP